MSQQQFEEYREKYETFEYRDYEIARDADRLKITYHFSIPGLADFTSRWEFPGAEDVHMEDEILRRLAFNLGMVETISYYKIVCPKTVVIDCGTLTEWQQAWWRKLYHNGLGEFLYLNDINVSEEDLVKFQIRKGEDSVLASHIMNVAMGSRFSFSDSGKPLHDPKTYHGVIVPVGGGKDSVVSLELLRDEDIATYEVNGNETTRNVVAVCDHKRADYVAKRVLDKTILRLNEEGYLNGHIPFSAVLAFSGVIQAYITGHAAIALSNENSANESTVPGSFVNHQYSKSYEFEQDFMEYFRRLTDSNITYFSLLRPLTELQIAALFARYRDYHPVFRSCNRGSKTGIWCCDCPKCLFVYIILSPFLSVAELHEIFGQDLLDKESLDNDFRELCGIEENKPFECVGTRREVMACLKDFVERGEHSLLTDRYRDYIEKAEAPKIPDMLDEWMEENGVPAQYLETVRTALEEVRK